MLISELSAYLRERRRASLDDMVLRLDSSPDAVKAMLALLERKHKVREVAGPGGSCGGCHRCGSGQTAVYEWVADGGADA